MDVSWAVRSVRAAVFAVVCVLLATAGHTLATGSAPPLWVDAAGLLPVFAASAALAGRECALPGIAVTMLAVQGGLHLAFDAAGPADTPAHGAGMPLGTPMAPGMHMSMHLGGHAHAMTPHALGAHLAAALAASWCLRRGEAALWSLLRKAAAFAPALSSWWRGWRTAPLPSYAGPPRPRAHGRRPLRQALLRHALHRRGPPPGLPYPA
ncbi:hypothetical protein AB0C59_15505 [Streptomyces sp. NPDC048664]|uniref:hypothetical protein n=1 Tax=Streptomyces sp. NPDC048664 TaxID=3154505 RepID=UPI0034141DFF